MSKENISTTVGNWIANSTPSNSGIARAHGAEGYLAWVNTSGINPHITFEEAQNRQTQKAAQTSLTTYQVLDALNPAAQLIPPAVRLPFNFMMMNYLKGRARGAQLINASCPVDVEVVDANGTVVASFSSHQLVNADQGRLFAFSAGETDFILLPQNEEMTVRITGNADGSMELGLIRMNEVADDFVLDESEVTECVSFTDIPVYEGKSYLMKFASENTAVPWVLLAPDGEEYEPDLLNHPIYLPDALTAIEAEAYLGCTDLIGSIICPDGLTSIGASAFSNSGITGILIPRSVQYIADDAFEDTSVKIYCIENSTAHDYAVAHNIPYEFISDGGPDNPIVNPSEPNDPSTGSPSEGGGSSGGVDAGGSESEFEDEE